MGQLMDKFHGSQWRDKQIRKITDKVYDRFKQQQTGSGDLTFEDIYIAVLLVYNDMNKYLPGPHFDPPSRAEVKATMEIYLIRMFLFPLLWTRVDIVKVYSLHSRQEVLMQAKLSK
ncbi:hypothetical protein QQ045_009995 [Rhodiola kirilowii]